MPVDPLRPVSGSVAEVIAATEAWLGAADEPAPLVVETSGSTGRPKRVLLSRRAIRASGVATAQHLGVEGQWLLTLPATYVAGLQVVARSLAAGHAPVVLDEHPDLTAAVAAMAPGAPHLVSLVPTQLARLLDDLAATAALAGFAAVLLGGGPIDPALRARAEAAGVRVVATYGSAETAGGCVYDGWPLAGVRLELEADGRVRVAGPTLFDGYADDPDLTAEVLVDGWFRTSDAGRFGPDGRLELLGRVDDVVVSGGVNVPGPAVARRLREHPGLAAVEVLGADDPEWGRRVVAFVVPTATAGTGAGSGAPTLDELRDWVAAAHPRAWAPRQLLVLEALPLLANGKTDRLALLARAEQS
ncbi:AMP-binding protein [Nocardioides zeae]|uniref:AMP-binding protein n=1 Tax=Nocardioides imazamoxiresistens TaxID=3231893 RepID=A0ABU3PZX5_9ACTN|nr:AMP-binding protein [Nocardioides zeae]MDT9594823.1 AMP-binding protein [Nocardioides zeae]